MSFSSSFWLVLILLLGAYFLGSIPTAYLAGRWVRGIDVRRHGTGNVGGSNVYHSVARWAVIPVGLFDIFKAVFPAWLALVPLDLGYTAAVAAGLAATMGHSWSIFLGFTGGRGLGCILGTLAVVYPMGALVLMLILAVGYAMGTTLTATIGLLLLPFLSQAAGNPSAVTWGCVAMIILTAVKRLEANRRPLPEGEEHWPVIWRRLLWDRDIADHEEWLAQRPESDT